MITHLLFSVFCFFAIVPTGDWEIPRPGDKIDRSMSSYEIRQKKRVDLFDFSGEYANLKNIDIDGKRLKAIKMVVDGEYPLLESICFDGGVGHVAADLTGTFDELEKINFTCNGANLDLDLKGDWKKDCTITLTSSSGNMNITLPKDVGVVVVSKAGFRKFNKGPLTKKGWLHNKKYFNEHYEKAPITLFIQIEAQEGIVNLS